MNNVVQATGSACCDYIHRYLERFRAMYQSYKATTDETAKKTMGVLLLQTVGHLRDGPWMHEAFLRSRANAVGSLVCRSIQEKRACLKLLQALKEIFERPRPVDQIAGLLQIHVPIGGRRKGTRKGVRRGARKGTRKQRGRGLCGSKACPVDPQQTQENPASLEDAWTEFERLQKQGVANMGIQTKPATNKNLKELEDLLLELELLDLE